MCFLVSCSNGGGQVSPVRTVAFRMILLSVHRCVKAIFLFNYSKSTGTAVAQWLRCCATNRKVAGSIPATVSRFFIDIKSFRSHYGPGVDSASNRNEYQDYFLGVKAAGAWGWQPYHHPVPLLRNLGTLTSWNPLGLSRPVTGLLYGAFPGVKAAGA